MLTLMLEPRFESLRLIFFFTSCELEAAIIVKYDRKSLFPMLLRSYHHLHPLFKIESSFVNKFDENNSLDNIFEIVVGTNEPAKELVDRELMIFHKF
jgi:hypothetical protein